MNVKLELADKTPRSCGGCTLCCKLLPMQDDDYKPWEVDEVIGRMVEVGWAKREDFDGMVPPWKKAAGVPCQHQRHKGCAIYATRPWSCRLWNCRWLTNNDTADLRRPDRSRYVIDLVPDFVETSDAEGHRFRIEVVQIWVDPKAGADVWRDPALLAYIERRAAEGIAALLRFGGKRGLTVFAPSFSSDGKWKFAEGTCSGEHRGAELIHGIATAARNFKIGDVECQS